jgi:hypothetical protein
VFAIHTLGHQNSVTAFYTYARYHKYVTQTVKKFSLFFVTRYYIIRWNVKEELMLWPKSKYSYKKLFIYITFVNRQSLLRHSRTAIKRFTSHLNKNHTVVPPYPRIIRSKTYRSYMKPQIIPNAIYIMIFV